MQGRFWSYSLTVVLKDVIGQGVQGGESAPEEGDGVFLGCLVQRVIALNDQFRNSASALSVTQPS
jgi:hypothetical protein